MKDDAVAEFVGEFIVLAVAGHLIRGSLIFDKIGLLGILVPRLVDGGAALGSIIRRFNRSWRRTSSWPRGASVIVVKERKG